MLYHNDLKQSGFISTSSVRNIIAKELYGSNWKKDRYNNLAEYEHIVNLVLSNLKPIKKGDGKATRYYYNRNNVMAVILSLKKTNFNIQENTELYGEKRKNRKEYLEKKGYISGVKVKERLWKFISEHYFNNSYTLYHKVSKQFPKFFCSVYGEDSCKKLGVGSSTRYYYLGSRVSILFEQDIRLLHGMILKCE